MVKLMIENNKSGWIFLVMGGIGMIFFIVIGFILMFIVVFVFFRKKFVRN